MTAVRSIGKAILISVTMVTSANAADCEVIQTLRANAPTYFSSLLGPKDTLPDTYETNYEPSEGKCEIERPDDLSSASFECRWVLSRDAREATEAYNEMAAKIDECVLSSDERSRKVTSSGEIRSSYLDSNNRYVEVVLERQSQWWIVALRYIVYNDEFY